MKVKKGKKLPKNKLIKLAIFGVLLVGFIYFGTINYHHESNDAQRFSKDYSLVDQKNVFKYISAARLINIIKHENGIVFMAFKENDWSNYYASILNEAAQELKIKEIYYYDFYNDRKSDNSDYEKVVDLLKNELITNDEGRKELTAPSLLLVNKEQIIAYDNETSYINGEITPKEYWSKYQKEAKKSTFKAMINNYLNNIK